MLHPLNKHVLIEPIEQESIIASATHIYEEMGIILEIAADLTRISGGVGVEPVKFSPLEKGDKVFFDSWTAAKYPTGEDDKFYWLVPYESIRMVETKDEPIPE